MPLTGSCDNTQKIRVDYQPKGHDADGNEVNARVDGALRAEVIAGDPAAQAIILADNPLQVQYLSGDVAGLVTFKVTADADLGEGFREISDTFDLVGSLPEPEADKFAGVVQSPD